jgi:hypothetical protein
MAFLGTFVCQLFSNSESALPYIFFILICEVVAEILCSLFFGPTVPLVLPLASFLVSSYSIIIIILSS